MRTVSLEEAQLHLGELLDAAQEGEQFLIAREGKALAELTKKTQDLSGAESGESTADGTNVQRRLGFYSGQMTVPDDFDTMFQDEIEKMFFGEE